MLVLLPPSETKAPGGDGPPLDLSALSFAGLTPVRERLLTALTALAADPEASRAALGLGATGDAEIAANAALRTATTVAALDRYTGVLYEALAPATLDAGARERAERDVVVTSALFGALRGGDRVPAYRLSAGSRLAGVGPLAALWRPALAGVLDRLAAADAEPLLDLRSGGYAALWGGTARLGRRVVPVQVVAEAEDGSRTVVSHANKAAKGRLARALLGQPAGVGDDALDRVVTAARSAGLRVERAGRGLDLVEPRRPPRRARRARPSPRLV